MKNILIIEDDPFLREIYTTKLTQKGFRPEIAVDGKSGMAKIKKGKPDLILLDIILPKTDGFEILKEVKATPNLKKIPIILLTNLGQKNEIEKGLALGAEEYIIKAHSTPTAVVAKIKEILARRR